jgi:hypothetical protein
MKHMFVHTLILPDQYEVSIEKSHDSLSKPLEISITKTDPINLTFAAQSSKNETEALTKPTSRFDFIE